MRKGLYFFVFLPFFLFFYDEAKAELSFYKETEHFQAFCLKEDRAATEDVLQDLEQYYKKCSRDFRCLPSLGKIRLNVYPDIQTFHSTVLKNNSLPHWKVSKYAFEDNTLSLVTPKNPGTMHSEETVMKSARSVLGFYFMHKKCAFSPRWLSCGLALYEAKAYSKEQLDQYLFNRNGEMVIPSLSQLEEHLSTSEVDSRSYLVASYAFVEFLVTKWGLDKALAILDDDSSFESILGIAKEEFRKGCVQYYQPQKFVDTTKK